MRLEITRIEGRRNDLLLRVDRDEIADARLSVATRAALLALPGMPRHRAATEAEAQGMAQAKEPIERHLARLGVVGSDGRARGKAVAISNRNLGTNHGHAAWQRGEDPPIVRIGDDPTALTARTCLTARAHGQLAIETLRFDVASQRIAGAGGEDVSGTIAWATYGQQVLRAGQVTPIDALLDQFYDLRHVLAFDHRHDAGDRIRRRIYEDYPASFRERAFDVWRAGVPRARYYHNAVGLSGRELFVLQREGTIEEIGAALAEAGATDGVILDNGGSVACWAWWVNDYAGGLLSPTVDYRPPGTSAIAFVLKGPEKIDLPGGSVSYSTA